MNRKLQIRGRANALRLTAAACAALCLSAAMAEEKKVEDKKTEQLERVEVVGSHIKRIQAEGPSPVAVFTRADIEKTGAVSAYDVLRDMVSTTGGVDGSESNSFALGASYVSLRGMDTKNVLVLLNGRRVANYSFAEGTDTPFVDLNTIPTSAIEQVQVLRDGASAIYGSDAVAGVINFVTRKNFQGVEGTMSLKQNTAGDMRTGKAGLAVGFGNIATDKFNLLATLDLAQIGASIPAKHPLRRSSDLRPYGGLDGRATNLNPGSYYNVGTGYRYAMPGCVAPSVIEKDERGDEYCRTQDDINRKASPDIRRVNGALLGTWDVNPDLTVFGELALGRNTVDWTGGYSSLAFTTERYIAPGWAAYKPELGKGAPIQPIRAVYEAGRQEIQADTQDSRLLLGARGSFGAYDWDTALTHSANKATMDINHLLKRNAVTKALQQGGFDPFKLKNSDADVQALLTSIQRRASSKLSTLDFKLTNAELFKLGGPVGMAAGVQLMNESMEDAPDAQITAQNIENMGGTASKGKRHVASVYTELALNPVKQVEVQVALRADKYSDFGTTVNPKLALSYRPVESLLLRGGYNTAFKAPSLQQLHMGETQAYAGPLADWVRCKPIGYTGNQCAYYPKQLLVSNPELKPEKTRVSNLGFVYNPLKDLDVSVDFYSLKQRDAISLLDGQFLLDNEFVKPGFDKLVLRDPRNPANEARWPGLKHGRLNTIITPFMNVGRIETSGFDLQANYAYKFGDLKLTLRDSLNRQLSYKSSYVEGEDLKQKLDGQSTPKWRNALTIGLEQGAWAVSTKFNTTAGTLDIGDISNLHADEPVARLGSYTSIDLNLRYRGFKELELNVGGSNVGNRKPRWSTYNLGWMDTLNGPQIYANLRYRFQ